MQNTIYRKIVYLVGITGLLLSIPLLFSWPWTLFDFIVMGALIMITGLLYVFVTRNTVSKEKKIIIGAIFLFVFLLIWVELAVGLFGSPFAGS